MCFLFARKVRSFMRNRRRQKFSFCSFSREKVRFVVIVCKGSIFDIPSCLCHHLRNECSHISAISLISSIETLFALSLSATFNRGTSGKGLKNKMMLKNACAELHFSWTFSKKKLPFAERNRSKMVFHCGRWVRRRHEGRF